MLVSETRGASGEFPLQVRPRLAVCGGATGWGGATSGVGLSAKLPSASTAWGWSRARLLRSAAVQLEGLAPALPVYSELPTSGAHLRTLVTWLCVVVPRREGSEVYVARGVRLWRGRLRAVGVAFPRSRVRPGLALQPNSGRVEIGGALMGAGCILGHERSISF